MMAKQPALTVACAVSLLLGGAAAAEDDPPYEVSGRYPHLAMFNSAPECGVGALALWQGRLYAVTYAPHAPTGSDDKLYIIDADLRREAFPGSVGGTPANRMIHRESRQLLIGPYLIDEDGGIRVIPPGERPQDAADGKLYGRITANARHLTDPGNKAYYYDMEGLLYEVDVRTLDVALRYVRPIPGWHAKGAYTGQGRLALGANGEHAAGTATPETFGPFQYQLDPAPSSPEDAGALADWDGDADWRLIRRRQFTEITGPGGIHGAPDDAAPVWAIGWDKRSLILMVMEDGDWTEFRLPKADFSYDARHGWYTEWPRIREAVPATDAQPPQLLMTHHGGLFAFPPAFSARKASGLRPIGSYLKIISDWQAWNDRIVFACNETAKLENPYAGQAQSNLWFADWDALHALGPRVGWGGPWVDDDVSAGEASAPFLIGGYDQRVLHLAHQSPDPVRFQIEADPTGRGDWEPFMAVGVPARGYVAHILPPTLDAQWIRIRPDRDALAATACFHLSSDRGGADDAIFEGLADLNDAAYVSAIIRPRGDDRGTLHMWAVHVHADGAVEQLGHYEIGEDMILRARPDDVEGADRVREIARVDGLDFEVDAASVVLSDAEGRRYRLPKTEADYGYADADPACLPRGIREVVTERSLLNAHGTFYMLPRDSAGGTRGMKPIATHNKRIMDFCSWRGMLVVAGIAADAPAGAPRLIRSDDGRAALWFGDIDDLWRLGKPRGVGGPWRDTPVVAGEPSDPYLMTGYDRKRIELRHDAPEPVRFTLEVDVLAGADAPETYHPYAVLTVPPNETLVHDFAEGYAAHWIRLTADADCTANATLFYE